MSTLSIKILFLAQIRPSLSIAVFREVLLRTGASTFLNFLNLAPFGFVLILNVGFYRFNEVVQVSKLS